VVAHGTHFVFHGDFLLDFKQLKDASKILA
jgi:hypothetical protein